MKIQAGQLWKYVDPRSIEELDLDDDPSMIYCIIEACDNKLLCHTTDLWIYTDGRTLRYDLQIATRSWLRSHMSLVEDPAELKSIKMLML